ncbi:MAG: hypothetical protein DRI84_04685 [Bacteroidetes bacterium]|nr:MAG: hypothetical protein DRI84_04685 [Bacteroidota bacterium]
MTDLLEILKYILPSGIVLLTAWLLLKSFLNTQEEIQKRELKIKIDELQLKLKQEDKKYVTPIRLQAYERIVLFLERIAPQSMIFRVQKPGQKVYQLQNLLLKSIRDEYEHNLSQQLYISKESWGMVRLAKDEIVKLINTEAANVKPDDESLELSRRIFEATVGTEKLPTDRAIDMLKKEIHKLF